MVSFGPNGTLQAKATAIASRHYHHYSPSRFPSTKQEQQERQLVENTDSICFFLLNCLLILCRIILLLWTCLCVLETFSAWFAAHGALHTFTFYLMWAGGPSWKFCYNLYENVWHSIFHVTRKDLNLVTQHRAQFRVSVAQKRTHKHNRRKKPRWREQQPKKKTWIIYLFYSVKVLVWLMPWACVDYNFFINTLIEFDMSSAQ